MADQFGSADIAGSRAGLPLNGREFAFSDADFEAIRDMVKQLTGINLSDSKRELVYGRVSRRLRTLRLSSFREYLDYLSQDADQEMMEFCNAITTNLTAFFRESHHFDYLGDLLREMRQRGEKRRLRFWSAGCSTGEEPYSLAMTIAEAIPDWERWDIRVLATDLDSQVLGHARKGRYSEDRVKTLGRQRLERFFHWQDDAQAGWQVNADLAAMITFKQLNLIQPFPMRGPLDAIFCRNVIIYFDKNTQRDLFQRISQLQTSGGLLFLGHSESLFKVSTDYNLLGKTIYQRV